MPRADPELKREAAAKSRREWKLRNRDKIREGKRRYHHRRGKQVARFRKYGVSAEQFNSLMLVCGGRCPLCRREFNDTNFPPMVDHDHNTGEVRGLLCNRCNWALGVLEHDNALERAILYLAKEL